MTESLKGIRSAAEKCDNLFRSKEEDLLQSSAFVMVADLSRKTKQIVCISSLWLNEYCSGPALGARLWAESVSDDDDNPVVITAVQNQAATTSSIVFKSPITSGLYVNTLDCNFGRAIADCGCVALVLKGKMTSTGVLEITPEGCSFENMETLSGFTTDSLSIQLKHSNNHSVLSIGPAGERKLLNAVCVCDGRETGRGGLGCVFGTKNLKAVSIRGKSEIKAQETEDSLISVVRNADYMGWAPVENFTGRTDPRLFHISLNEFSRTLKKNMIRCSVPPVESIMMLGGNSGCFDAIKVVDRYRRCVSLGIDPVFVGNYIGAHFCGCNDESVINSCITSLAATEVDVDDLYTVNGMTVGACDYRGNAAQALSDSSGYWFPLFYGAGKNLAQSAQDKWASFAEDVTLGLESLGMDVKGLMIKASKIGYVQAMFMKYCVEIGLRNFLPDDEAKAYSKVTGDAVDSAFVLELGRRCKRLFFEINQILGAYMSPEIPDHFCIDPDSNMPEPAVVPFNTLVDSYIASRNFVFAKQDAKAAKKR